MKVLWVVNSILRDLNKELFGNLADGVWMDALLSEFKGKSDYSIVVVTTAKRKTEYVLKKDNVTYYLLPDAPPISYNENKKSNIACWKALLEKEKPDFYACRKLSVPTEGKACIRRGVKRNRVFIVFFLFPWLILPFSALYYRASSYCKK